VLIALGALAVMFVVSSITYRRVAAREEAAVLRRAALARERMRALRAKRDNDQP
jgi:hypothetical protein